MLVKTIDMSTTAGLLEKEDMQGTSSSSSALPLANVVANRYSGVKTRNTFTAHHPHDSKRQQMPES